MIEEVVEFVDFKPSLGAFGQRPDLLVSVIKVPAETSEEMRHRQIGFAAAIVGGGVDQDRFAFGIRQVIPAPKIAVEQARRFGGLADQVVQSVEQDTSSAQKVWIRMTFLARQFELEPKAVLAPELDPIVFPTVGLGCAPQVVVLIEAVTFLSGLEMKLGELASEGVMEPSFRTPSRNVLHHDKGNRANVLSPDADRLRNANRADVRQRLESFRFAGKQTWKRVGVGLEEVTPSIFQPDGFRIIDAASPRAGGTRNARGPAGLFLNQSFDGCLEKPVHNADITG